MKVLAITSGKGGVGKTTFSVNIARQLSLRGLKTLLIDFDIHNQGVSGLFMVKPSIPPRSRGTDSAHPKKASKTTSVIDLVQASTDFTVPYSPGLLPDLSFDSITPDGKLLLIPASLPDQMIEWRRFHAANVDIVSFFRALFEDLRSRLGFDSVVIDCYGGIDSMTVAAAGIADDTIIVNEPDIITFTGTLKLYRYILEQYQEAAMQPSIHFVINRITSRHSYQFLHDAYAKNLTQYSVDDRILAYFPFDKLIIETFGDYPFFSEILPRSLFTRKIRLLIEMLWGQQQSSQFHEFSGLSMRRKTKVQRQTSEFFFAEPDRIIRAFVRVPFFLCVPIVLVILLRLGSNRVLDIHLALLTAATASSLFIGLTIFVGIFEPYQISRWMFREATYHRRKAKLKRTANFASRLFRATIQYGQSGAPIFLGIVLCFSAIFYCVRQIGVESFSMRQLVSMHLNMWAGGFSGLRAGGDYSGIFHNPSSVSDGRGNSLAGVKFLSSRLNGTRFLVSNLSHADFTGASLEFADFSQVSNLRRAHFGNELIVGDDEYMGMRRSYYYDSAGTLPDSAKFVDKTDFTGTTFEQTHINTRFGANSNFEHASFNRVDFGIDASLGAGSNLRGANFTDTGVNRRVFWGTQLAGAKFTIIERHFESNRRPYFFIPSLKELDTFYLLLNGAHVYITRGGETQAESAPNLADFTPGDLAYDLEANLPTQDPNAIELDRLELAAIEHADSRYQPWASGAFLFLKIEKGILENHPDCESVLRFNSWLADHDGHIDWVWITWDREIFDEIEQGRFTDNQKALLGNLKNIAIGRLDRSYLLTLFSACTEPSPSSAISRSASNNRH